MRQSRDLFITESVKIFSEQLFPALETAGICLPALHRLDIDREQDGKTQKVKDLHIFRGKDSFPGQDPADIDGVKPAERNFFKQRFSRIAPARHQDPYTGQGGEQTDLFQ